ncbi:agmatinase family protein [Persicobacter diffluens]|uniref:Agmatinase n=1 Tax=Persicobacter diffluens TaxID=981 RepID=A0AAN5AM75_9BACT|nr:agmatinase [Persicobacter diffluens]
MIKDKKQLQIAGFNPNGVGVQGTLFGMPFDQETADLVVIPMEWDVTVSYGAGTRKGPSAILQASPQLDFYQEDIPDAWKMGVTLGEFPSSFRLEGEQLRPEVEAYIEAMESGEVSAGSAAFIPLLDKVQNAGERVNDWLKQQSLNLMAQDKLVGVLGGDHSTPLGLIQALAELRGNFGILQIDAHADLRDAYEAFEFSHASIMFNALKVEQVEKLVQVGIRDYCEDEAVLAEHSDGRVQMFTDRNLKEAAFKGITWHEKAIEIVQALPDQVYISFDIDGLDPKYCPNTGTPVPGGMEFDQAMYLIELVVKAGKTIIGFDLCEVGESDDEWDANVGARVLYRLSNLMGVSQNRLKFKD